MSQTSAASASSAPAEYRPTKAELERGYWAYVQRFMDTKPPLLEWSLAFRVEEGHPLEFDSFPFQPELYEAFGDQSLDRVSVMKSGQCGISAAAISMTLWAGDVLGANVLYVLPGAQDAYDFSDSRVTPAIEGDRHLHRQFALGTDNKGLKRIGNAWIYFRGSVSEKKALSIPADVLVLDEFDRLDQRNVPKFRKRLGSPNSLKLIRQFSNPSLPEFGIHKQYNESDMRRWLITCPSCNHEAPIRWDAQDDWHWVDEEKARRTCGACGREIKPQTVADGRWVAEFPQRTRRGYHISKLIVPGQPIDGDLLEDHNSSDEDTLQAHFNFDLGEPYSPRGGSLSIDEVRACKRDYQPPDAYSGSGWVTAGMDVGRTLHLRVSRWLDSGQAAPLYIGELPSFEEAANVWRRYNVNFGLIDIQPEEKKAREFCKLFPGRAMVTRWSGEDQRDQFVVDDRHGLVVPRRTWAMDQCVAQFREQMRLLPRYVPSDYELQVTAPIRILQQTLRGEQVARYVSVRPADHYFFAETYDCIARMVRAGGAYEGPEKPPEPTRSRAGQRREGRRTLPNRRIR